jgi:hypothetical protein
VINQLFSCLHQEIVTSVVTNEHWVFFWRASVSSNEQKVRFIFFVFLSNGFNKKCHTQQWCKTKSSLGWLFYWYSLQQFSWHAIFNKNADDNSLLDLIAKKLINVHWSRDWHHETNLVSVYRIGKIIGSTKWCLCVEEG